MSFCLKTIATWLFVWAKTLHGEAQTDVAVTEVWRGEVAERHTAVPGVDEPTATPNHAAIAR